MAKFLQTFKGTSIIRTVLLLLVSIFSLQTTRAQDFITDVVLIGGSKSETDALKADYSDRGYTLINKDLNAGAGGDYIYLLYRKGSVFSNESFITDFYIKSGSGAPNTITDECGITYYLTPYDGGSHFKEQKGDLNMKRLTAFACVIILVFCIGCMPACAEGDSWICPANSRRTTIGSKTAA